MVRGTYPVAVVSCRTGRRPYVTRERRVASCT